MRLIDLAYFVAEHDDHHLARLRELTTTHGTYSRRFDRQGFMRTLGAVLESVEAGTVTIACGFDERLTQQHGLFHGGVVASLVDVACGYAALSLRHPSIRTAHCSASPH